MPKPAPVDSFLRRLQAALDDGSFVELRLRPDAGSPVTVRRIALAAGAAFSFTTHEARSDRARNVPVADGLLELAAAVVRPGTAWLATTLRAWQLVVPTRGRARCVAHRDTARPPAPTAHDAAKQRRLGPDAAPWLHALDLVDAAGRPRPARAGKLRQVERYADLLAHLASACGWPRGATVRLADMGCGKGYLTFAAWHVLRHGLGLDARVVGIDAQPALVDGASAIARRIGAEGLLFQCGSILDATLGPLDALVALHACNDATDHALRRGVEGGAALVVVAPCCHKDLRRGLGDPAPLAPVLEHGLFREQFAQWLTDGLRAIALEAAGYRVRVAEFVAPEHTPRNTLISGVRQPDARRQAEAARRYGEIKTWAGLGPLATDAVAEAALRDPTR